ncbi:MAG TPA: penicillin acylase family protein [Vicinamibacterales bacterium]
MRRVLTVVLVAIVIVLVAGLAGALWAWSRVRASLPLLDGNHQIAGLTAPVQVQRDGLGIPSIRGATREDVARALGFLHAQDRFFQMDLARRRAAGELAALVGVRALALDHEIRIHRFRAEARRAVDLLTPSSRQIVDAYTAGVNGGLASLGAPPFEYLLLRQEPQPWKDEDSFLVVLSMFITLQDTDGSYESTLGTMHDVLPQEMFEFLAPKGTEWDAPVAGETFSTPPIPGPDVYNLRARRAGRTTLPLPERPPRVRLENPKPPWDLDLGIWDLGFAEREALGSNNWAVSGALTADGSAIVANDMHLFIRVPNTWYRASMEWPDAANPADPHRLVGVTLPGVPALVTGSNTHIAWGFTNTYADWGDLVQLETDPANPDRYMTPDGWREFERFDETIDVTGEAAQHEQARWTIWGPVLGPDHRGRLRAYSWVAHSADRLATTITPLESAHTIDEAFDEVNGVGIPGQNLVVVDRTGRIGWTVYGAIPRRVGLDGVLPSSWADGSRGWKGWLERGEYPRILDPPDGRIWTANARVVGGDMLARLGDGSYEVGARARQIRERLMARDRFTVRDMLAIQMDASSEFLDRWRQLLLDTLTPAALQGHADRADLRQILGHSWSGRAAPDSAAYAFVHRFRDLMSERVTAFVLSDCYEADPTFDYATVRRREGPIWKMVTEKPQHLLDPQYATWDEVMLSTIDQIIADAKGKDSTPLNGRRWSDYNVTAFRHPLSAGVPLVGRWLDMPIRPLAGDLYTIQVHSGSLGASERMVVSPGHEAEGIMHMPTGQSGHPLSPFYANSHDAWVNGEPTPLLPGPAEHTLMLMPR